MRKSPKQLLSIMQRITIALGGNKTESNILNLNRMDIRRELNLHYPMEILDREMVEDSLCILWGIK